VIIAVLFLYLEHETDNSCFHVLSVKGTVAPLLNQAPSYVQGRDSKQVTNGSKTAVMYVIVFLCVSLGSSTVQLHDSLGNRRACACSEAGFSSENDDRA
jgi:hypothetical protein